ncbi:peroxiredoxin family protein [Pelobium manganitolerans]|uniref:peroxiredoxin family protein n=1 Tax=Pelobium manganitolerans TaxID=1842495 RepID=UPI003FA3B3CA
MIRFAKLLCLMLLSAFVFAQEPAQKMPDFDFVNVKGGHTTQADLDKNKKTLIVFFDATCPHCQKASAFFNMHLKELSKVNVLFVTLDEQKSINMFMQQYAPLIPNATNVKILRDTNYAFVPTFLPKRYPAIYVYDQKNQLQLYTNDDKELEKVLQTLSDKS